MVIRSEVERLEHTNIGANQKVQEVLAKYESTPLNNGTTLAELIRRPELNYEALESVDINRDVIHKCIDKCVKYVDNSEKCVDKLVQEVIEQININIKYDGYIKRQQKQVEQFKKLETKRIPEDINYDEIKSLRIEAVQKLKQYRPISIGQASRISGVSPADISVLLVYMEGMR